MPPTDAVTLAHYLRRRPVLMINALWDKVIPKQAVLNITNHLNRHTKLTSPQVTGNIEGKCYHDYLYFRLIPR